jgi:cell division septation protein DedD
MRPGLPGVALLAALAAAPLAAQTAVSPDLDGVERLVQSHRYDEARRGLAQWWESADAGANGEARARGLYLRAVLAADVAEAERDLLRLAVEHPHSPYADRALFRLAQSRLVHQDTAAARMYLERLVLDHPRSGHRAEALALLGRRETVTERVPAPSPAPVRTPARSPAPAPAAAPSPTRAEYTVQLGRFSSVAEAESLRDTLRRSGYSAFLARIGRGSTTVVRVGSYTDRAAAEAMMRRLRAAGHAAEVVVVAAP